MIPTNLFPLKTKCLTSNQKVGVCIYIYTKKKKIIISRNIMDQFEG
jgi:hypothetical protein